MKKRKSDEGATVPDQRSFKLLKDTIEGSKFDKSLITDADYFGKTPMQAAKSAFLSVIQKMTENNNVSYIFSVQENGGNNKIYTYKSTKEGGTVVIKACKKTSNVITDGRSREHRETHKKNVKKAQPPLEFEDDGIHIEKKVIPPLAKPQKKKL